MRARDRIPSPICAVVGEILGDHYYSHARLETLFLEAGAPGDPPAGNCRIKCTEWLRRASRDHTIDCFSVLGGVLEDLMEIELDLDSSDDKELLRLRHRIEKQLKKHGFEYQAGGKIYSPTQTPTARHLAEILRDRDFTAIEIEHERALESIERDPEATLTAACAMFEAFCNVYIEDEDLTIPKRQTAKELWKVVNSHMNLDGRTVADEDVRKILSGLSSIIDGFAALRTHAGSAHGRGRRRYRLEHRHVRLVVHSTHALVSFLIETWDQRSG